MAPFCKLIYQMNLMCICLLQILDKPQLINAHPQKQGVSKHESFKKT